MHSISNHMGRNADYQIPPGRSIRPRHCFMNLVPLIVVKASSIWHRSSNGLSFYPSVSPYLCRSLDNTSDRGPQEGPVGLRREIFNLSQNLVNNKFCDEADVLPCLRNCVSCSQGRLSPCRLSSFTFLSNISRQCSKKVVDTSKSATKGEEEWLECPSVQYTEDLVLDI